MQCPKNSLKANVRKEFLSLFNCLKEIKGQNKTPNINLYILKSRNGEFLFDELEDTISEIIVPYALSRKQYQELRKFDSRPYITAVKRLLDNRKNNGEFGEIMLFSFLESQLKAPKIATKLELKTTSNEYVKGSDGIHLLRNGQNSFQIIFGESKTISKSINQTITQAINSINNFKKRKKNGMKDELNLVQIHLDHEYSKEEVSFIKKLLIPSETHNEIDVENAFGMFISVPMRILDEWRELENKEFDAKVKEQLIEEMNKIESHLANKIEEKKLKNFKFYVYVLHSKMKIFFQIRATTYIFILFKSLLNFLGPVYGLIRMILFLLNIKDYSFIKTKG